MNDLQNKQELWKELATEFLNIVKTSKDDAETLSAWSNLHVLSYTYRFLATGLSFQQLSLVKLAFKKVGKADLYFSIADSLQSRGRPSPTISFKY